MIDISLCHPQAMKAFEPHPSFGSVFTPHVLKMELTLGSKPTSAVITPIKDENLTPNISSLHYAQCIFEGMKAYRNPSGKINLFRPEQNAERFKKSALKLNMAPVEPEVFLQCLQTFVDFERDNIPDLEDHSLYLRPLLIASDPRLKVGQSEKYLFYIMGAVVGDYFSTGTKKETVSLMVNRDFVRAFPGGLGNVKAAANYAMGMSSQTFAKEHGCAQVLYLDSVTHNNIDELGGMNFFAVRGNELVTPKLTDCILPGITRDSLLKLAHRVGLNPVEETMSFDKMALGIESGLVSEVFACGTAATVQPIGEIIFMENSHAQPQKISLKNNKIANELRQILLSIQMGQEAAPNGWIVEI